MARAAAPPAVPSVRLVHVTDAAPGMRRERRGDQFVYLDAQGQRIGDEQELARIRRLAIPPAYTDVWICPRPNGHLQATGRDARGRKQYRYHPQWQLRRSADKFERMQAFGAALPRIRARVNRDLARPLTQPPARESVLAALVRLLDTTYVRVGNDKYTRANGSFGLTTLRNRHARVHGSELRLQFRGKSGVMQQVALEDPRVARIVRRCQALPGQELFQYEGEHGAEDGAPPLQRVDSDDVNAYLREAAGEEFSAKDFRTWHATVLALQLAQEAWESAAARCNANEVLSEVAKRLGNTVAVCRKSYVHPDVIERAMNAQAAAPASPDAKGATRRGLTAAERRLLDFLAAAPVTLAQALAGTAQQAAQRQGRRTTPSPKAGGDAQRALSRPPAPSR